MLSGCFDFHAKPFHAAPDAASNGFFNGLFNGFAEGGNGSSLFGPGYGSRCTSAYLLSRYPPFFFFFFFITLEPRFE